MTDAHRQLLLDAGWKESTTVPGYWIDPLNGTLYDPLVAWRISDERNDLDYNTPELQQARFELHQQSKGWRDRRKTRGLSTEHYGMEE